MPYISCDPNYRDNIVSAKHDIYSFVLFVVWTGKVCRSSWAVLRCALDIFVFLNKKINLRSILNQILHWPALSFSPSKIELRSTKSTPSSIFVKFKSFNFSTNFLSHFQNTTKLRKKIKKVNSSVTIRAKAYPHKSHPLKGTLSGLSSEFITVF